MTDESERIMKEEFVVICWYVLGGLMKTTKDMPG
jgi:hypothetical protein